MTYSKIAEDKQISLTTNIFTLAFFEENHNNILDGLLTFWRMIGVVQGDACAVVLEFKC
jgi:hypothetical protein